MDAIHYHMRNEGSIVKRAVYVILGIDPEAYKDVLGMYVGKNKSAKFWLNVINGLKNRSVEDNLIESVDGLNSFPQAIESVYPQTSKLHHPPDPQYHTFRFLKRLEKTDGRFK